MNNLLDNILDNRYVQRIVIVIAIINVIRSFIRIQQEAKIFKDVINENNEFFASIATLGFAPTKFLPCLVSIMPYEPTLTLEEIEEIANKTVIGAILGFVKNENLLGIMHVDCKIKKSFVVTTLQPSSLKMFLADVYDFAISSLITSIVIIAYFSFFA